MTLEHGLPTTNSKSNSNNNKKDQNDENDNIVPSPLSTHCKLQSLTKAILGDEVKVSLPGNSGILSLAEVEVNAEYYNVAIGKPATQSSDHLVAIASHAVDGNINGNYFSGSVTHTTESTNPWWYVDLRAFYTIHEIKVYNRIDCCRERLHNFILYIMRNDIEVWKYNHSKDIVDINIIEVPAILGDEVKVSLPGNNRILSLAEVQVIGEYNKSLNQGLNQGFTSKSELQSAVDQYCQDPDEWINNARYATYGYVILSFHSTHA